MYMFIHSVMESAVVDSCVRSHHISKDITKCGDFDNLSNLYAWL